MKDPIPFRIPGAPGNPAEEAVATLRAVASLPARAGLEERVKAGLSQRLRAGLPAAAEDEDFAARGWVHGTVMRGLAAAAIVLIVVGGGWGVAKYGRPSATPRAIGVPRMAPPGDFSNAGAMRTPQTLTPPAVPHSKPEAHAAKRHADKAARVRKAEKPIPNNGKAANAPKGSVPEPR